MYNFKNNTQLYLVYSGIKYKLDVYPGVTFSQTFSEKSVPQKTLHAQTDYFANAAITRANPANFSFTMPLDLDIVVDRLLDALPFDLYAKTNTAVYKIANCVLESGRFVVDKNDIALIEVSGSGSRLSKAGDSTFTIPGTLSTRVFNYFIPRTSTVSVGGNILESVVNNLYMELRNEISWLKNDTLQRSLLVTDPSNTIYPESYVVTSKILSGAITQYVQENNDVSQSWSTSAPIYINVDSRLIINIPSAVFTNRLSPEDVYTQVFDFRMLSTTTPLSSVITY